MTEPKSRQQQQQRRRELNRVYARRHYYKALHKTQQLQTQMQELQWQCKFAFIGEAAQATASRAVRQLEQLHAIRDELLRENAVLRQRKEEFLKWEFALSQQVENRLTESSRAVAKQQVSGAKRRQWSLIHPLTVETCHAMAQAMYSEVQAFNESEHFVSSGSSVLGWTDKRRVENNRLKFSLQKVFPHRSAYELMMRTWSVLSSPDANEKLYSKAMKMRCELVQQVDPSNVLMYQEYEAKAIDPRTGAVVVTIGRRLLLQTIFETESGYITLFYSMDPHRLANWPQACDPVPIGACVRYETMPYFTWTSYERVGPTGEDCRVNYVGGVHKLNTSPAFWYIEVLLMVLRWEGFVVGPTFTLLPQEDTESDG